MFGLDAGFLKLAADVDAVADIGGEHHGLAALGQAVPVGNDVADELRPVHALGEFAFNVVAGMGVDAFEVRRGRRIDRSARGSRGRSDPEPGGTRPARRRCCPSPRPSFRHGVAVMPMISRRDRRR